jgi:hypothetical protein
MTILKLRAQDPTTALPPCVDLSRIEEVFKGSCAMSACCIQLSAADGKVRLRGQVHTWGERNEARHLVWSVPGVVAVEDWLEVVSTRGGSLPSDLNFG